MLRELGERGSVAAVAEASYITPSAVSQHLAALQSEFSVPLTEKRARKLVLTDAGRALAASGVTVEASFASARAAVDDFLESAAEPVTLSAFHSAGLAWFPTLLTESVAPLRLADADVAFDDFPRLTLKHDIVIAHRLAHDSPWPRSRVVATPLLDEPLAVAVRSTHPLAHRTSIAPSELAELPWVSVHEGFPLARALEALGAAAGRPLNIVHTVNEFFVAAAIVRSSDAAALIPIVTMRGPMLDGITLIEVEGLHLARQIDALTQPHALHRRAVRETLELLQRLARSPAHISPPTLTMAASRSVENAPSPS